MSLPVVINAQTNNTQVDSQGRVLDAVEFTINGKIYMARNAGTGDLFLHVRNEDGLWDRARKIPDGILSIFSFYDDLTGLWTKG